MLFWHQSTSTYLIFLYLKLYSAATDCCTAEAEQRLMLHVCCVNSPGAPGTPAPAGCSAAAPPSLQWRSAAAAGASGSARALLCVEVIVVYWLQTQCVLLLCNTSLEPWLAHSSVRVAAWRHYTDRVWFCYLEVRLHQQVQLSHVLLQLLHWPEL